MEKFKNRRKNYYIKKEFQRNFILKFCALLIIGCLISGAIIYGMSRAAVTTTFENSRLAIRSTADYILPAVLLSSAIVIFVIGIATIFVTLFASHRIAGPLYRLEKDVDEITGGNLNIKFNLRAGDEIKPLASGLDKMAQELKGRVIGIKNGIAELESIMDSSGKTPPEVKARLQKLKNKMDQFST